MPLVQYFWKEYNFRQKKKKKKSAIFPIILIYNFSKMYVGNLHIKLYQPI